MKMKLLAKYMLLVSLLSVFVLTACSSSQQNSSVNSEDENKNIKVISESSPQSDEVTTIANESFANDWKEEFEATVDEIERNRRKWQESKIENYSFEIAKYAGGTTNPWNRRPVLIKIQNGEKTIEKIEKGYDEETDGFEDIDTIDKLFNYLRKELENGKIIEAKYHKKFGYPKEVFIIYTYEHNHNSHNIFISKFEVLR